MVSKLKIRIFEIVLWLKMTKNPSMIVPKAGGKFYLEFLIFFSMQRQKSDFAL